MLDPQSRTLLLDALKPPVGYRLDYAIGTTYTLDLVALLAAPLAFALLDRAGPDGRVSGDPVALLEALRRNADRFAVFCQAGRISVPKPDRLLLSFLEQNVLEVTAPKGGVFHPKVWALRFASDDQPVVYRFICASRNLTFDRSWDIVVTLEGPLEERKNAIAVNHPLGDFFSELGRLAREVPPAVNARLEQFQGELRRVAFEPPDGFEDHAFFPLGVGKYKDFMGKERIDRMLVVSPFVSRSALERIAEEAGEDVHLVSRFEELQALESNALEVVGKVSVFSDEQPVDEEPGAEAPDRPGQTGLEDDTPQELTGLHAKLYVADQGRKSMVWAGSANATNAAFNRNVEFMVGMRGRKNDVGIDRFLATEAGQASFASFLKDYEPDAEASPADQEKREVEEALNEARLALATAGMRLQARQQDGQNTWTLRLVPGSRQVEGLPPDLEVRAWPITCRSDAMAKSLGLGDVTPDLAVFEPLTFEALTSFIAIELALSRPKAAGSVQFVLNLPIEGLPKDRAKRLLLHLLNSSDAVLRYIQLLLEDHSDSPNTSMGVPPRQGEGGDNGDFGGHPEPLLEPLVRALHRDPRRLDDVARLVDDLKQAGAGARQLPDSFDDIWIPIWEARKRLSDEKPSA